jgi:hypothetical protein
MNDYVSYVVMDVDERRLMSNAPHESIMDVLDHVYDFITNIEKLKKPLPMIKIILYLKL